VASSVACRALLGVTVALGAAIGLAPRSSFAENRMALSEQRIAPHQRSAESSKALRRKRARSSCVFKRKRAAMVTQVVSPVHFVLDDGTQILLQNLLAPARTDVTATTKPRAGRPSIAGAQNRTTHGWPIVEATRLAVEQRLLGRNVTVAVTRRKPDRYGRRLAQVWIAGSDGHEAWLQAEWLREGYARFAPERARQACATKLMRAEAQARTSKRGVWALHAYQPRSADDPRALSRLANTFQVVIGRVVSSSNVKGRVYVNFGRNWRRDVTALISKRQMRFFARHRIDPLALAGRRILVRGWVTRRGGPLIEIDHTAQIEVLDEIDVEVGAAPAGDQRPARGEDVGQLPRPPEVQKRKRPARRTTPGDLSL